MQLYKTKKVTIITEAVILDNVIKITKELGADGYTVDRVAGKGESGGRFGYDIGGMLSNVRIEIITTEELAKKIATEVEDRYFTNFAGIVYLQNVEVCAKKFCVSG